MAFPGSIPGTPRLHQFRCDTKEMRMEMMKTKETTYVRKLAVGDYFHDRDGTWIVTRPPVVHGGKKVRIGLTPGHSEKRTYTRYFDYDIDSRVTLY